MKLEPFYLERWLLNPCKYELASAGIVKLRLKDIITEIDYDMAMSYGVTRGSDLIRQRIAELFSSVYKDNVLVTSGTAEANFLASYRLLEKGDEVLTILPTYMQTIGLAKSFGARVKSCYLRENEGYTLNIEEFKEEITNKTKIVCLVNPNNPTGSVISSTQMRAICEIAEDVDAWVLCDGALRGLEVDGNFAPTPVEIYEKGIATGSLSKIGLAGIRIGWLIADKKLVEECWAYKDYTTLSHSGIGEYLGTVALKRENISRFLRRAREIVRTHSAILCNWVSENSRLVRGIPPKAGHTAFLKYNFDIDSRDLCLQLVKAKEVLVSPGIFFGSPRHLRVRYGCEREVLIEGLRRIGEFLDPGPAS
jgi:aspartate/methionine/tyrosine aminotransferase